MYPSSSPTLTVNPSSSRATRLTASVTGSPNRTGPPGRCQSPLHGPESRSASRSPRSFEVITTSTVRRGTLLKIQSNSSWGSGPVNGRGALDWQAGGLPGGPAAANLGRAPPCGELPAGGVVAQVDRVRRTGPDDLPGQRDALYAGWPSIAAPFALGPQVKQLSFAARDLCP